MLSEAHHLTWSSGAIETALISHLKVFPVNDKLYYGIPGLATDVYTLSVPFVCVRTILVSSDWEDKKLTRNSISREHLRFRVNMYRMKEEREITPKTFTHLVSSTLYEKRYVRQNSRIAVSSSRRELRLKHRAVSVPSSLNLSSPVSLLLPNWTPIPNPSSPPWTRE